MRRRDNLPTETLRRFSVQREPVPAIMFKTKYGVITQLTKVDDETQMPLTCFGKIVDNCSHNLGTVRTTNFRGLNSKAV